MSFGPEEQNDHLSESETLASFQLFLDCGIVAVKSLLQSGTDVKADVACPVRC
jgi:hypothetical protein